MKKTLYLIFNRFGYFRHTIKTPRLSRDEIAVKLRVEIPDSIFQSPVIEKMLTIEEDQIISPTASLEVLKEQTPQIGD